MKTKQTVKDNQKEEEERYLCVCVESSQSSGTRWESSITLLKSVHHSWLILRPTAGPCFHVVEKNLFFFFFSLWNILRRICLCVSLCTHNVVVVVVLLLFLYERECDCGCCPSLRVTQCRSNHWFRDPCFSLSRRRRRGRESHPDFSIFIWFLFYSLNVSNRFEKSLP